MIMRKFPDLMFDLKLYRTSGTYRRRTTVGNPLTRSGRRLEQEYPCLIFRQHRYLVPRWGADGNNAHKHDWYKSTVWEYWIPGCLTECSLRFHKYFRISSHRFDMIYETAALSGLFGVYPDETTYSEVHPEDPGRPGKYQDHKRIPLCLMIGTSMWCVPSGNTFNSLGEEFHIGDSKRSFTSVNVVV